MRSQNGRSGNLRGRPTGHGDVRALARLHTEAAVQTSAAIMGDKGAAATARTAAASALLDRAWGIPEQTLSASVVGEAYADVLRRINAEEDAAEVEAETRPCQHRLMGRAVNLHFSASPSTFPRVCAAP